MRAMALGARQNSIQFKRHVDLEALSVCSAVRLVLFVASHGFPFNTFNISRLTHIQQIPQSHNVRL